MIVGPGKRVPDGHQGDNTGDPVSVYSISLFLHIVGALISRADVAHAMLVAVGQAETIRQEIGIAY